MMIDNIPNLLKDKSTDKEAKGSPNKINFKNSMPGHNTDKPMKIKMEILLIITFIWPE